MENIPDHPVIKNLLETGYPDRKAPKMPRCPICDEETDTLYKDNDGFVVGCPECVTTCDAWEYEQ